MQLVLFNPLIGLYQLLPFWAREDLGAMAMKGCSAFPKAPASLEPHHQIYCHTQDTHWGGLTPLQRCSRCILQPQPTRQRLLSVISGHSWGGVLLYSSSRLDKEGLKKYHQCLNYNLLKSNFVN